MSYSPWMHTITTGTVAQGAKQLSVLIAAIDANVPVRCQWLRLEFDLGGSGVLRVGNSDVSTTNCGFALVPAQEANSIVFNQGLVLTSDYFLLPTVDSQKVNVTLVGAGA
jgi:hypothetical protein